MTYIRRINLYAGPGAGKSATCAKIFAELKIKNYNTEQVHEYIKSWVYSKRSPQSFEQHYIFAKQMHAEDIFLSNGVDMIVTDSPLAMQIAYAKLHGAPGWRHMTEVLQFFEHAYPAVNIFLDRTGIEYQALGRYHDEKQALELDKRIHDFVSGLKLSPKVELTTIPTTSFDQIMGHILNQLKETQH